LGVGVLGTTPNSPIPNPQSPIPNKMLNNRKKLKLNIIYL